VIDLKHPNGSSTKGPGNPVKLSRCSDETFDPAPLLGQDTDQVFQDLLGYDNEQIQTLRDEGIIA
jgi:CoA:oxalate CoA-transferase